MPLNNKIQKCFLNSRAAFFCFLSICLIFTCSPAFGLEINFTEHGKKKALTGDAQRLFKHILPKAETLDLRIARINRKETAVMTVLLDRKAEDGFMIMKEIPEINSYTYLVAWMLQGHYYFLKEKGNSDRQKKHFQLLSRHFDGKTISGDDTYYIGESVELYYQPMPPKIRGMNFTVAAFHEVLYSGTPRKNGFAKILVPGFKPKYIAILPKHYDRKAFVSQQ